MTLEEALRQHLGCQHEIEFEVVAFAGSGAKASIVHRDGANVAVLDGEVTGTDAAAGSALFHDLSNRLIGMPGHTRTPMHITDEEYAGFVS